MNVSSSSPIWTPIRAFAALFISAVVLGAAVLTAAFALLVATLVFNAGGVIVQVLTASLKILGPAIIAIVILTSVLLGFGRSVRA